MPSLGRPKIVVRLEPDLLAELKAAAVQRAKTLHRPRPVPPA